MKKEFDFRCKKCKRKILGYYHKWKGIEYCWWCKRKLGDGK